MYENKKILITGAAGFLGGRTAKYFAKKYPTFEVIASSRRRDRKEELEKEGCIFTDGDLSDETFCNELCQSVDIIIHCAALSAPFGPKQQFIQANLNASKNILHAAIKNKVAKFIFISTPSIYFNYENRYSVKESDPLPKKMVNAYASTKLEAESYILSMNSDKIQTIALRPRAIIGAEDTVIFPRIMEAQKQGKLKIIGNGTNICDLTCVRNVIEAIECAIKAPEQAYGEAYNITDGKAIEFWPTLNYAFKALNLATPKQKIPLFIALFAASIFELKAKIIRNKKEPALTRYGVGILANSFTLDITKAKELLNYSPIMSTLQGIDEYIEWHRQK